MCEHQRIIDRSHDKPGRTIYDSSANRLPMWNAMMRCAGRTAMRHDSASGAIIVMLQPQDARHGVSRHRSHGAGSASVRCGRPDSVPAPEGGDRRTGGAIGSRSRGSRPIAIWRALALLAARSTRPWSANSTAATLWTWPIISCCSVAQVPARPIPPPPWASRLSNITANGCGSSLRSS